MNDRALLREVFGNATVIQWHRRSGYGIVAALQNGAGIFIGKIPVPWMLADLPENERECEARRINQLTLMFHRTLSERQVPVPARYETRTQNGFPIHTISYEGPEAFSLIKSEPARAVEILLLVIRSLTGFLEKNDGNVGVDARLTNFGIGTDTAVYIDLFPSLLKIGGECLVHYPNPRDPEIVRVELARKFSAVGTLRRLRFDLIAANPSLDAVFRESLKILPAPLRADVLGVLDSLPAARFAGMPRTERAAMLSQIDPREVDTMREIAAVVIPQDHPNRELLLRDVFFATSLATTKTAEEHAARHERFCELVSEFL